MKFVYITIYVLLKLLSGSSIYLCNWGLQTEKKPEKSGKINKGYFIQNMFFRQTAFSLQKNHLFFQVSLTKF